MVMFSAPNDADAMFFRESVTKCPLSSGQARTLGSPVGMGQGHASRISVGAAEFLDQACSKRIPSLDFKCRLSLAGVSTIRPMSICPTDRFIFLAPTTTPSRRHSSIHRSSEYPSIDKHVAIVLPEHAGGGPATSPAYPTSL